MGLEGHEGEQNMTDWSQLVTLLKVNQT